MSVGDDRCYWCRQGIKEVLFAPASLAHRCCRVAGILAGIPFPHERDGTCCIEAVQTEAAPVLQNSECEHNRGSILHMGLVLGLKRIAYSLAE